jgi:hypothetical protein
MQIEACETDNKPVRKRIRRSRDGGTLVYLGCDLPIELMELVKAQAHIEERTVSAIIRRALAAYISREETVSHVTRNNRAA